MLIRHANGHEVTGEVLEVSAPERLSFTYEMKQGGTTTSVSSRVTIQLHQHPDGTLLQLRHEFADAGARTEHVQGWRFQLSLFANLVANSVNDRIAEIVDRWCAAWSNPDAATRNQELTAIAAEGIRFADRFSAIEGLEELRTHLDAVHHFMPGIRLERHGNPRHCQWRVLADWVATGRDGVSRGAGTNSFLLDADGRISEVTGFWAN